MTDNEAASSQPTTTKLPTWLIAVLIGAGVVIVGLFAVVIVLLTGDGEETPVADEPEEVETFDASGTMTLISSDVNYEGTQCFGEGGYGDMQVGAQVVVRDGTGESLAVGRLNSSTLGDSQVECIFTITVEDIPAGRGIYSVEVGSRGEVSFEESAADSLAITLG